jgi:hypothetical protein
MTSEMVDKMRQIPDCCCHNQDLDAARLPPGPPVLPSRWLSDEPEKKDLLAFTRGGFKSRRLKKKFMKSPDRYKKRIIKAVWAEWETKRWWKLGLVIADEMRLAMERESFMRRALGVGVTRKDLMGAKSLPPATGL